MPSKDIQKQMHTTVHLTMPLGLQDAQLWFVRSQLAFSTQGTQAVVSEAPPLTYTHLKGCRDCGWNTEQDRLLY